MKVLAIIPARYNSSRFPGKPLIDIKGKTMIQRVYEQTLQSKLVDKVVVATDDDRILDEVKRFGGEGMMTSDQHRSGTERCGEVLSHYNDFDIVINIQGDEPLINPSQIDAVLALFSDDNVKIATVVKAMKSIEDILNPNRIKVVLNHQNEAIYFSRSPIPYIANFPKEKWLTKAKFWKHIGIYAWRREILQEILSTQATDLEKQESLEQLRWMYYGYPIKTVETDIETPNIDTPEDLNRVLAVLG